ncbi:MAG: multidrug effflux MFS transporter [Fibrobacteria bacterium]|nr:multidrug effflux MFS transporter [Fibrobacteria bacterium]
MNERTLTRRGTIFLLGALAAMGPFSIDTYLPAFPEIARDLGVTVGQVGFSLATYFFGICLGQLVYGPLMDRYGRRTPLLWGLALYLGASLLCAFSPTVLTLSTLRFVQALGGCAGMVAGRALVRDLFPDEAAQVFSSLILVMGVAPIVAPSVGGWLVALWGWRSIFLFLSLVSAILFLLILRKLPDRYRPDPTHSFHPRALAKGWLAVLSQRDFLLWGIGGSFGAGGLFAYLAGSPATYMEGLGLSSRTYAWVFAINAAGLIGASQTNRWLLRHFPGDRIVRLAMLGQLLSALGLVGAVTLRFSPAVYPLVWLFLFGQGLTYPNVSALAMAPFGRTAGSASALMGSFQMASGALLSGLVGILPGPPALPMALAMVTAIAVGLGFIALIDRRPDRAVPTLPAE